MSRFADQSKFDNSRVVSRLSEEGRGEFKKGFADVGKRLESVGKGFSLYVTAPIAALGVAAVNQHRLREFASAGRSEDSRRNRRAVC